MVGTESAERLGGLDGKQPEAGAPFGGDQAQANAGALLRPLRAKGIVLRRIGRRSQRHETPTRMKSSFWVD